MLKLSDNNFKAANLTIFNEVKGNTLIANEKIENIRNGKYTKELNGNFRTENVLTNSLHALSSRM